MLNFNNIGKIHKSKISYSCFVRYMIDLDFNVSSTIYFLYKTYDRKNNNYHFINDRMSITINKII